MRKVKYTEHEKIAFSKIENQKDGYFHVWENTDGIIETVDGNMIKVPYSNFSFNQKPRVYA